MLSKVKYVALLSVLASVSAVLPASAVTSHPQTAGPAVSVVTTSLQANFGAVGQQIDIKFHVVNTGTVSLSNVVVHDVTPGLSPILCPSSALGSSSSMDCTTSYVTTQIDVNVGSFSSSAQVSASPPTGAGILSASSGVTVSGVFASRTVLGVAVSITGTAFKTPNLEIARCRQIFAYIASLGANAVSINFPFYLLGQAPLNGAQHSNTIVSGAGTPTPQLLSSIIHVAQSYGLKVEVRPLLSELGDGTSLTGQWRGTIAPTDLAAWFASYTSFLTPYLLVARQSGASSFSIGAELNSLIINLRYWVPLFNKARTIFGPNVLYSDSRATFQTIPRAQIGYDAYNPVTPPSGTTVTSANAVSIFQAGILKNLTKAGFPGTPRNTVLQEVSLPAVANAWTQPYFAYYPPGTAVTRWVQTAWLTANCNVVRQQHFGGLYFWALDYFSFKPTYNGDVQHDPYNWEGTPAEDAVKACFAAAS